MRELGWGLIVLGVVFGLLTAHSLRTGLIVDRSIRIARARDPRGFRSGIRFFAGYAIGCAVVGLVLLGLA